MFKKTTRGLTSNINLKVADLQGMVYTTLGVEINVTQLKFYF